MLAVAHTTRHGPEAVPGPVAVFQGRTDWAGCGRSAEYRSQSVFVLTLRQIALLFGISKSAAGRVVDRSARPKPQQDHYG